MDASTPTLGLAERPTTPRARSASRPVPVRCADFAHLSLDALREHRTSLAAEEGKVSYWRRIIQARLDVVREGRLGAVDSDHLRPVLSEARPGTGRSAMIEVMPVDQVPPLPNLGELWDRQIGESDERGLRTLERDLAEAESQLSTYRHTLHERIGAATIELIARYREEPTLCLSALPLAPARAAG